LSGPVLRSATRWGAAEAGENVRLPRAAIPRSNTGKSRKNPPFVIVSDIIRKPNSKVLGPPFCGAGPLYV